jgi:hypothetical protein
MILKGREGKCSSSGLTFMPTARGTSSEVPSSSPVIHLRSDFKYNDRPVCRSDSAKTHPYLVIHDVFSRATGPWIHIKSRSITRIHGPVLYVTYVYTKSTILAPSWKIPPSRARLANVPRRSYQRSRNLYERRMDSTFIARPRTSIGWTGSTSPRDLFHVGLLLWSTWGIGMLKGKTNVDGISGNAETYHASLSYSSHLMWCTVPC